MKCTFGTRSELSLKLHKDIEGREVDNKCFKKIVRSLMYLTSTRPDIIYVVSMISHYMECPTKKHLNAARRIFRYVRETFGFGGILQRKEVIRRWLSIQITIM